ncbi:FAD-dependent thymidylate synthase [Candidatus Cyanaurora vandensis]|uniref:FAD-dependent thymidylate synthase n=1 Tax=Candidatus Cyanaurora vandensis TaxID=2714958 RepID=UPI00257ABBE5|nr:FAD-dependent thymidylate synthase [Candidatus Cyanaurora vandensis]
MAEDFNPANPLGDGISTVHLIQHVGDDQMIAAAARVSLAGDLQERSEEENYKLIKYLLKHEHGSPLEHNLITYRVTAPLYVVQEMLRHRAGTCLTGDAEITFVNCGRETSPRLRTTIGELYRQWTQGQKAHNTKSGYRPMNSRMKKRRLRVLNEETGLFTVGHIADITAQGIQPVFQVTLEDGKTLKMTSHHRVLTDEGWKRLDDAVGLEMRGEKAIMTRPCSLMVNGVPMVGDGRYRDAAWLRSMREKESSLLEIADAAGCSIHTISKWLKKHSLSFTEAEREFAKGNTPWNRGCKGYSLKISPEGQEKRRTAVRNRPRENNYFWRGGVTEKRALIGQWTTSIAARVHERFQWVCQGCKVQSGKLHAHHIIPVWMDESLAREIDNLISLCHPCHRLVHRTQASEMAFASDRTSFDFSAVGTRPRPGSTVLRAHPKRVVRVEYVGEEETYDLAVAGDWHNFVANGIVVHNSFNQQSGRYIKVKNQAYVPVEFRGQSKSNRQASVVRDDLPQAQIIELYAQQVHAAYQVYEELLNLGVCREQARGVLPHCTYTSLYFTVNVRSLLHFLGLRLAQEAQFEIRQYARSFQALAEPLFPLVFRAMAELDQALPGPSALQK